MGPRQFARAFHAAPRAAHLCLFHSFILKQFTPEAREPFARWLGEHSTQPRVSVIGIECFDGALPTISLSTIEAGQRAETLLAHCHAHGEWLEWKAA